MTDKLQVFASRKTGEALQEQWDGLQKRIVALEMALSEIADGRVEGFEAGDEGAVFFLQERARRALINPFN